MRAVTRISNVARVCQLQLGFLVERQSIVHGRTYYMAKVRPVILWQSSWIMNTHTIDHQAFNESETVDRRAWLEATMATEDDATAGTSVYHILAVVDTERNTRTQPAAENHNTPRTVYTATTLQSS